MGRSRIDWSVPAKAFSQSYMESGNKFLDFRLTQEEQRRVTNKAEAKSVVDQMQVIASSGTPGDYAKAMQWGSGQIGTLSGPASKKIVERSIDSFRVLGESAGAEKTKLFGVETTGLAREAAKTKTSAEAGLIAGQLEEKGYEAISRIGTKFGPTGEEATLNVFESSMAAGEALKKQELLAREEEQRKEDLAFMREKAKADKRRAEATHLRTGELAIIDDAIGRLGRLPTPEEMELYKGRLGKMGVDLETRESLSRILEETVRARLINTVREDAKGLAGANTTEKMDAFEDKLLSLNPDPHDLDYLIAINNDVLEKNVRKALEDQNWDVAIELAKGLDRSDLVRLAINQRAKAQEGLTYWDRIKLNQAAKWVIGNAQIESGRAVMSGRSPMSLEAILLELNKAGEAVVPLLSEEQVGEDSIDARSIVHFQPNAEIFVEGLKQGIAEGRTLTKNTIMKDMIDAGFKTKKRNKVMELIRADSTLFEILSR